MSLANHDVPNLSQNSCGGGYIKIKEKRIICIDWLNRLIHPPSTTVNIVAGRKSHAIVKDDDLFELGKVMDEEL